MQKSLLALGVAAIAILATAPAHGAPANTFSFQFDHVQAGDQLFLSVDDTGNFVAKVAPALQIVGGAGTPDGCVTTSVTGTSCEGATGPHTGAQRLFSLASIVVATAAGDMTVSANYGAGGLTTYRCHLNANGVSAVVFVVFGVCGYSSFGSGSSWTVQGTQDASLAGVVTHVVA